MRGRITRLASIAIVVFAVAALAAPMAGATPIDGKQAQASALQPQLNRNGERIEQVGERMSQAKLDLQRIDAQLADSRMLGRGAPWHL